jgi:N-acetylmuramic acid 6-phosphate etherase
MPRDSAPGVLAETEARNPRTQQLDRLALGDLLALLVDEHAGVVASVRAALPELERAAALLCGTLESGGRWLYAGAGTSGRLAAADAAELPPTFGSDPERVQCVLAGGEPALARAVEGAEDDPASARAELIRRGLGRRDAVVALSASGSTPFAVAALEHARERGAHAIAITCAADSRLASAADVAIVAPVGPEPIAGSTRMKAGLAQKLILNVLSTAVMVRLGHVEGNLMTHLRPTNAKLRDRATRILCDLTGCSPERAQALLAEKNTLAEALAALRR